MRFVQNIKSDFLFWTISLNLLYLTNVSCGKCGFLDRCERLETTSRKQTVYSYKCNADSVKENSVSNVNLINRSSLDTCKINRGDIYIPDSTFIVFVPKPLSPFYFGREDFNIYRVILWLSLLANEGSYFNLDYHYVNGFYLDTKETPEMVEIRKSSTDLNLFSSFLFAKSNLNFYLNKRPINQCEDLENTNPRTIFQLIPGKLISNLQFNECRFKQKLCPAVFKNSYIYTLQIQNMVKSFLKTNTLTFYESNNRTDLNSIIFIFYLYNMKTIDIDSNLLNSDVFKHLTEMSVGGEINRIEPNVFKSFRHLKFLSLSLAYYREFIHRNGIEWMNSLNEGLDFNVSQTNEADFISSTAVIYVWISNAIIERNDYEHRYPDADFCIYRTFRFRQLLILIDSLFLDKFTGDKNDLTCTYLWLTQYYELFAKHAQSANRRIRTLSTIDLSNLSQIRSSCNFTKLLDLCNFSSIESLPSSSSIELKLKISYAHSIIILALPGVCLVGILTNILIVVTLSGNKKKEAIDPNQKKNLKHHDYMRIHSIVNALMLAIELVGLMNECSREFWCSRVYYLEPIQYYKIVFRELIGTLLRFMSNFTFVAFALTRLSLIGKDHNAVVKAVVNLKIYVYLIVSILIGLILSVVKYFRYSFKAYFIFTFF